MEDVGPRTQMAELYGWKNGGDSKYLLTGMILQEGNAQKENSNKSLGTYPGGAPKIQIWRAASES